MRKLIIILVAASIVAALVLVKIFVFSTKKEKTATPAAAQPVPVECYVARDTTADYRVETVGTLLAREQVDLVSEIQRKVVAIYLKEGATVKAGQLLFKLDDADITSRIRKLELEAELAEANEAREQVLLTRGGVSQEQFDKTSNRRKTLRAEIDVLKVDLAKTEIRAPFSGRIGLRNVSIGALVNPGHTLANLQDISRMNLDFSVPERYSLSLRNGTAVAFKTDYLPVERISTVEAIEPSVDQRTRTLRVRASVTNADGTLVPGTSAKVFVTLQEHTESIFVPSSVLIPSISGYMVFKASGGKAVAAPVKTGTRSSEQVQILEGIIAGDTLVATNLLRVRNGSPLKIQTTY